MNHFSSLILWKLLVKVALHLTVFEAVFYKLNFAWNLRVLSCELLVIFFEFGIILQRFCLMQWLLSCCVLQFNRRVFSVVKTLVPVHELFEWNWYPFFHFLLMILITIFFYDFLKSSFVQWVVRGPLKLFFDISSKWIFLLKFLYLYFRVQAV